jgi:4-diphosphocytidyl-2-C-methyl-D-erythritol kinase
LPEPVIEFAQEFAPAKINLCLHITGQRADGFHLLESLVTFADIGDTVTVSRSDRDQLIVDGPFAAGLEAGAGNLAGKARDHLRRRADFQPIKIHLTKNLPVSSGIGGGSSDAAATLRAIARLFAISSPIIADIAMTLGADVPMCLAARPLIATGIGEQLTSIPHMPELHLVLVNPNRPVSTPEVFQQLSSRTNPQMPGLPSGLSLNEFTEWLSRTRNDLQLPALQLCPAIGDALIALAETGPKLVRMSGSGATCYGLFPDAGSAHAAASVIAAKYSNTHANWWVKPAKTGGKSYVG